MKGKIISAIQEIKNNAEKIEQLIETKSLNLTSLQEKRKFIFKLTDEKILKNAVPSFIDKSNAFEAIE